MAGIESTTTRVGTQVIRVFREDSSLFQKKVMKNDGTLFLSEFAQGEPTKVSKIVGHKLVLSQDVFTKKLENGDKKTVLNTYNLNFKHPDGSLPVSKSVTRTLSADGKIAQNDYISHYNYVYVTKDKMSEPKPVYTDTVSIRYENGKKVGGAVKREENDLGV
jgi:hypothetical protein